MEIDHINIKAPPELLERVREFYCGVLGLKEGFRPALSSAGHWLYGGGKPLVHLSRAPAPHANSEGGSLDHVAFRVQDGAAFRERLELSGISYRSSQVEELELVQFFLRDPAGNGIEVNYFYGGKE